MQDSIQLLDLAAREPGNFPSGPQITTLTRSHGFIRVSSSKFPERIAKQRSDHSCHCRSVLGVAWLVLEPIWPLRQVIDGFRPTVGRERTRTHEPPRLGHDVQVVIETIHRTIQAGGQFGDRHRTVRLDQVQQGYPHGRLHGANLPEIRNALARHHRFFLVSRHQRILSACNRHECASSDANGAGLSGVSLETRI